MLRALTLAAVAITFGENAVANSLDPVHTWSVSSNDVGAVSDSITVDGITKTILDADEPAFVSFTFPNERWRNPRNIYYDFDGGDTDLCIRTDGCPSDVLVFKNVGTSAVINFWSDNESTFGDQPPGSILSDIGGTLHFTLPNGTDSNSDSTDVVPEPASILLVVATLPLLVGLKRLLAL
jgi:hypothetical protein